MKPAFSNFETQPHLPKMRLQVISVLLCLAGAHAAPSEMNAWIEGKSYTSTATPQPGDLHKKFEGLPSDCEVLVKVVASSVNPCDKSAASGTIMGSDMSGTVVALGSNCASSHLSEGMKVWGDIGANTHKNNIMKEKTKENGAYAEYVAALDSQLVALPKNIDETEAAALAKVSLTSYKALQWYCNAGNWTKASAGPVVLVLGGSGGTGTTGIQMAKAFGSSKIITTTSKDNFEYCQGLGADQLIDFKSQNWWDVIPASSVDIVYDTVGQTGTGNRAMNVLRTSEYFGHYVTITGAEATSVKQGITQAMFINSDTNLANLPLLTALTELVEKEQLRMKKIDSTYSLKEIEQAFARSSTGEVVGKVSISVAVNSTDAGTQ